MQVDSAMHTFFANRLQEKINKFGLNRMDVYLDQLDKLKQYVTEKCQIAEASTGMIIKTWEA